MEEHLNVCQFVDINCPNECGKRVQKKDLPQHLEIDCPFETVYCPNECGKRVRKKDLPQHFEKTIAPSRQYIAQMSVENEYERKIFHNIWKTIAPSRQYIAQMSVENEYERKIFHNIWKTIAPSGQYVVPGTYCTKDVRWFAIMEVCFEFVFDYIHIPKRSWLLKCRLSSNLSLQHQYILKQTAEENVMGIIS
ncbi:TNF receptor-associated factor 4 [Desmophyllum pertusum]|uniref:TNF receptor-associated factor 4 n=1 Tax=Desmophyllum pertusum TaxID=174260 RepID=A0A9W9ZY89_9CNID|nr:TNF receptor-associated factor 4 [Desmophyllum pertusum]